MFRCRGFIYIETDDGSGKRTDYLYDEQSGDLTAVFDPNDVDAGLQCLAGPTRLTLAVDPPCLHVTLGYRCAAPDASAE